jgi:uncharacterized membrane protein HdeD (DUF308 family)
VTWPTREPADMLAQLGRHWGWVFAYGVLTLLREMPARGWSVVMGILSALAGIIVLAYPGLTLFGLAVILGIWLLIFGVMEITAALRVHRVAHR